MGNVTLLVATELAVFILRDMFDYESSEDFQGWTRIEGGAITMKNGNEVAKECYWSSMMLHCHRPEVQPRRQIRRLIVPSRR